MKTFLAKKRNIFLARLFLGQLPLLVSTYLFLSRQFLNFSVVFQFLLVVINLASILVTVYLTREMRMIWLVLEPINLCLSAWQILCLSFVCIEVFQKQNSINN